MFRRRSQRLPILKPGHLQSNLFRYHDITLRFFGTEIDADIARVAT